MVDNNNYNSQYSHPIPPMQGGQSTYYPQVTTSGPQSVDFQYFFHERDRLRKQAKHLNRKRKHASYFIVISVFITFSLIFLFPLIIIAIIGYYSANKKFNAVKEQLQQLGENYKEEYRRYRYENTNHSGVDGHPSSQYYNSDDFNQDDDCGDYGGWDDGGYDGCGGYSDGDSGGDGGGFGDGDGGGDGGGGDGD